MCSKNQKDYGIKKESNNKVNRSLNLGLVYLRKAIAILDFIVQNESIESVKTSYEAKQS